MSVVDPPELRVRLRARKSSLTSGVPASRLVVLLLGWFWVVVGAEYTFERRGDMSPSSLRRASAVPLLLAATSSMSTPSNSGSRVWRRIEAATIEGDEWCEWIEDERCE